MERGVKFYAGIGARKVPEVVGKKMTVYARVLEQLAYTLRSGGALGSDSYFSSGVSNKKNKEIFIANDAQDWCFERVKKCMPNDRSGFDGWKPYIKGLLARNMMQVLGKNGDQPVDFVVCWTPDGDYNTSEIGGTGYAVRCALQEGIPVYNLVYPEQMKAFEDLLRKLFRENEGEAG